MTVARVELDAGGDVGTVRGGSGAAAFVANHNRRKVDETRRMAATATI